MRISDWGSDVCSSDPTAVLAHFLVALGVARAVFRTGPAERALFGMGSVFSNTVLLAIPLIFTALGEEAGRRLMLIITFHSVIIFPVVTVLIELGLGAVRSEEHTSELQSLMRISYAVFCLKKKKTKT